MRKGPRLTLGWGPRMVNPALSRFVILVCTAEKQLNSSNRQIIALFYENSGAESNSDVRMT